MGYRASDLQKHTQTRAFRSSGVRCAFLLKQDHWCQVSPLEAHISLSFQFCCSLIHCFLLFLWPLLVKLWNELQLLQKLKLRMWIICLDPVSANSEKGRGSVSEQYYASKGGAEIAVGSCRAEQPEKSIWYKLSWKRWQLGGVCQALSRQRERLTIQMAGCKLCSLEKMACSCISWKYRAPNKTQNERLKARV